MSNLNDCNISQNSCPVCNMKLNESLEDSMIREKTLELIREMNGDKFATAKKLGISYATLWYRLKTYRIMGYEFPNKTNRPTKIYP